ncbi:hypothetical protein KKF60_03130 [Patescibacteria group bacterium]|nr:hypothetical protein [Patescibacteria group bacterium]MBU4458863.1 hypothetical protein [Patescibacteria group bacterium]MCG2696148.1 hypothetical protein [Candidatus Portnoybacteria bacterium]
MSDKTDFEKLENFINGVGAARMLLQRSHKQEFLIEALVLYATLIDGFCRIALVLKQQIKNRSSDFDVKYIHQDDDRDYYSERDIYKYAFEKAILEKDIFDDINALYDFRNKVIHRFLISEIEYAHLGLVLDRYELVFQRLWNIVYGLESEQIQKGVGMTIARKVTEEDKKAVHKDILRKVDTKDPEKLKQILGSKLIQDTKIFSERAERERISDEVSDEIEIREEKTRIPPGFTSVKEITKWAERKGLFRKCICGHEKVSHVNTNKMKKAGSNLDDYVKKCKVKRCKCKNYREQNHEKFVK